MAHGRGLSLLLLKFLMGFMGALFLRADCENEILLAPALDR